MKIYETTFIINPQTDDSTIESHTKTVSDMIAEYGGEIVLEDHMGTRRLAYAIRKLTQGYYGSFIFKAPSEVVNHLDRLFRENDAYLRHLTILWDGKLEELNAQKEAKLEAAEAADKKPEAAAPRPAAQRRPEAPAATAPAPEPVVEPAPAETETPAPEVTKPETPAPKVTEPEVAAKPEGEVAPVSEPAPSTPPPPAEDNEEL